MSFANTFLKKKPKVIERSLDVTDELIHSAVEQYLWAQRMIKANEEVYNITSNLDHTVYYIHTKEVKD